jgi:tRNA A-37 threonylcarbamoyl transferase component Bud32
MPKSVNDIINGLTATEKNAILRNGLDASKNEGKKLIQYYKDNPKEAEARVREVVERWYAQGGRSGVSGKPVALPGLDPKPGESRSSVDHQTPISRDRKLNPAALQTRKTLDKFENFLIAEEGPNTNRADVPWSQWHDNIVAGRRRKDTSATVNEMPVRAAKKKEDTNYDKWEEIKSGNYGRIKVSPDGTRAVKELLVGKDGVQGEFGPHEVELATKMGQLGHSPKVYRATDKKMEMDKAKGDTLWKGYTRGENEPAMNAAQATKAAAAIRDLHKLGFYHGDNHALQYLVDGNNVKMVDFGLSGPISGNPVRVMQDLAKIGSLVKWDNPELAGNPYVQIVNRHLPAYREVKGTSKAAKAEKERIAQAYLADLANLQ